MSRPRPEPGSTIAAAAVKHGRKATELSFLNAARWTMSFSAEMASVPAWKLPGMHEALLAVIATSRVDVRPGRIEPRAVARECKHYPRLRQSRAAWRRKRLRKAG